MALALQPSNAEEVQAGTFETVTAQGSYAEESTQLPQPLNNVAKAESAKKAAAEKIAAAKAAKAAAKAKGAKAVKTAKKYLGVPYVYAGASPSGFDCSGFTSYVYGKLGVKLSHNAQAQYGEGTHVSLDKLKPGDLVFFGGGTGSISHVGMYVGDGKYIHSPRPGRSVSIDSFVDRADCVGACRPY